MTINIPALLYLYNKNMNIDLLLYHHIRYNNINILENLFTETDKELISFNIICSAGLYQQDYKLIEVYLPNIHCINKILEICSMCCAECSDIKCYKILSVSKYHYHHRRLKRR
jgi:hypothetical protein